MSGSIATAWFLSVKAAPQRSRPWCCVSCLLACVRSDHILDLAFDSLQVEAGGFLHRRIFNGCLRQVTHRLLNHDETPELARVEVVPVAKRTGEGGFSTEVRGALEKDPAEG